jgi:serine/threonine protein kinase
MADAGVPVVGDFGLCCRVDEDRDGRNTQTLEAIGARKYMPPEWREGRVETPQPSGDVYSLGKILYWMFQGRVFDGNEDDHSTEHPLLKTYPVLLSGQTTEEPQPETLVKSLADELVSRTVRKRPEDRLSDASELEVVSALSGVPRTKILARTETVRAAALSIGAT